MRISNVGLVGLTDEEGFVSKVTPDQSGIPSIGFGHVVLDGESFPEGGITREQGVELKRKDLVRFEAAVNRLAETRPMLQHQYDAMVVLAYNIGVGGFESSSVRRFFSQGQVLRAADAFLPWCIAKVKDSNPVRHDIDLILAGRRWRERRAFTTGSWYPGGWANKDSWRDYQAALAALGFYRGANDGVPGPKTKAAVARMREHLLSGGAIA